MGILNTHGFFKLPAAAPILVNVCMILGIWLLSPFLEEAILGMALGVLIGGVFQFLVQLPATLRHGLTFKWVLNWKHAGIIKVGKLLGPAVLGFGVYEINILVDTILASLLAGGSISYLYYANRLVQLPLGVFGVALGIAILPTLTAHAVKKEFSELRDTLAFGIRLVLFITIPATVGLIILSFPIINTLWERGEFGRSTTLGTQMALIYYAIGLCAFAGTKVLVSAFYSLQDTKTPMKIGIYTMLLNIGLGVLLMGPLKHGGLALATSIASIFNAAFLVYILKKRLGRLGGRKIMRSILRLTLTSFVMGVLIYYFNQGFFDTEASLYYRLIILTAEIALGVLCFGAISYFTKNEELFFMIRLFKERKA